MIPNSFRAECSYDALRFLTQATEYAIENDLRLGKIMFKNDQDHPDLEVEFISDVPVTKLRDIAAGIEDCHVIVQTLRPVPLAENSLERDPSF